MNVNNHVLKVFDRFAGSIRRLGVDYDTFRGILEVKLMLDGRRAHAGMAGHARRRKKGKQNKPKSTKNVTLLVYAFMGLWAGMYMLTLEDAFPAVLFAHSIIMVMTGMTLIADYSSVILDSVDNAVLLPRPVDGRTLLAARLAHIASYLFTIVMSLSLGSLLFGTLKITPLFVVAFVPTLVLSTALVLFLTSGLYVLLARVTSAQTLRDLVAYFQIIMTVIILGGYQILPQIIERTRHEELDLTTKWWVYLLPPAWLAAPVTMLEGRTGTPYLVLTSLGVLVPLVALILLVRVLAPRFGSSLARMDESASEGPSRVVERRSGRLGALARLVARDPVERASFEMAWQICSRDRKFKLRTYPSFAMVIVFSLVMIMSISDGDSLGAIVASLRASNWHLFLLYFGAIMIGTCVIHLKFSDAHTAAWVYRAVPVATPGPILMGALKAIVWRYVLPITTVLALIVLGVWGPKVWADVIVAFVVTVMVSLIYGLLVGKALPFSQASGVSSGSGRFALSFLAMFLVAGLGLVHFLLAEAQTFAATLVAKSSATAGAFLTYVPVLLAVYLVIVFIATWFLGRSYRDTSWQTVEAAAQ